MDKGEGRGVGDRDGREGKFRGRGGRERKGLGKRGGEGKFRGASPPPMFFPRTAPVGYPCAKFRLPRPFGFRVRADVRDIRRTDGRTTDADDRLMPPPPLRGGGIITSLCDVMIFIT